MEDKIVILLNDNRELQSDSFDFHYFQLVSFINYRYSITNNYDFIYYRPVLSKFNLNYSNNFIFSSQRCEHRSVHWSKLLSVLHCIESRRYSYIVYIDSDCIFKDFSSSFLFKNFVL